MEIPAVPQKLLQRLSAAGYDAYVVGGCVRDSLLGLTPSDWDICTAAPPQEIKRIFSDCRTIDIGMRHGTIAVVMDGSVYEITTFRTDGAYRDHRRPEAVSFVTGVEADLRRRDFTINAMAFHPQTGLVDLYGGRQDLQRRLIRAVGRPETRFAEDALRIMRCLRFAAVYDFSIEQKTAAAVFSCAVLLRQIAAERIQSECSRLLCGQGMRRVLLTFQPVLFLLFPELERLEASALSESLALADRAPKQLPMRFAALFAALPEEQLRAALKRLKYSNTVVAAAVAYHGFTLPLPDTVPALKKRMARYGADAVARQLALQALTGADTQWAQETLEQLRAADVCLRVGDLAVNGSDLLKIGLEGRQIGAALAFLLEQVLEERLPNEKSALLELLQTNGVPFLEKS